MHWCHGGDQRGLLRGRIRRTYAFLVQKASSTESNYEFFWVFCTRKLHMGIDENKPATAIISALLCSSLFICSRLFMVSVLIAIINNCYSIELISIEAACLFTVLLFSFFSS